MNIGILIPGFGANVDDWALPIYQNLVRELAKSHDVRVIALRYPHTQQSYSYHNAVVYPLGYGAWTHGLGRLKLWRETWHTVKQLHAKKPFDVLHSIWADETGALGGWLGKLFKIPSVVTVAGGELVGFADINYGLQLSRYSRWIVNRALNSNQVIILTGQMQQQILNHRLHNKGYIIPLGIDPDVFYPSNIQRKPYHLIHVGSLIPVKNQQMLLNIMALLEDKITLDIVGEGILEDRLKNYAQELGITDRVNFIGNVPHIKLREYYSQAQLHILPSHHEAFGMVTLEAAACGTPTIGTPKGLIADGHDFTLTATTPDEFAKIIRALLNSNSEMEKLRQQSLAIGQKRYTIQQIADQHIELYKALAID